MATKATTFFPEEVMGCMFPGLAFPEDIEIEDDLIECPKCHKETAAIIDCERCRAKVMGEEMKFCVIICKCLCGHNFRIRRSFVFTREDGSHFEVSPKIEGHIRGSWEHVQMLGD